MTGTRLSSRERVLLALDHREPDRVPFNLTLTVEIYHRLREYLGLPPDPDKPMGVWTNVSPNLDLLDAMGVDFYYTGLNSPSGRKPSLPDDGLLVDEWQIGRTRVDRGDGSVYFEMVKHPLANASLHDIEDFPWPDPYDPARVDGLRDKIERIRRDTDKAIMAKFAHSIWEQSWWLYGMEAWMMDMVLKPEICAAIMDKVCDLAIGFVDAGIDAAGDLIDILRLSGEDLGTQLSPMISMHMYNQMVRPRFQRFWSFAKARLRAKNPSAKLMVHSCGNVRAFIPSWIEMGLDILDPIQPRATGMEPYALKRDFGQRLVFHGGIDLQFTLPLGTPDEVQTEVRRYIQALAPGGGYIVAPAHNVQSDVPPENLVAIRDAIAAYGTYPIDMGQSHDLD